MRIAYVDMPCGISGDMLLAALVDAGVGEERMREALSGLAPGQWEMRIEQTVRRGIVARRVSIVSPSKNFAAEKDVGMGDCASRASGQRWHNSGDETDKGGNCAERSYLELREYVERSALPETAKRRTLAMLASLAEAEAAVHGVRVEEVHFHEVGGLDTIVDFAGAVVALELLGIEEVYAQAVPCSHGYVETAHGRLPVPAPATVKLLQGLPVRGIDIDGETVTPTGAALLRHLVTSWEPLPTMTLEAVGIGAGTADFPTIPNVLRVFVGKKTAHESTSEELIGDSVVLLEANIDDMQPELFEPAMEAVFEAGAMDVWCAPIYMKHNRPAVQLNALSTPADAPAVVEAILRHTTTLGVRTLEARRNCLPRQMVKVNTAFGQIGVKVARLRGVIVSAQPEYRDCVQAARQHGVTVRQVYAAAQGAAHALMD